VGAADWGGGLRSRLPSASTLRCVPGGTAYPDVSFVVAVDVLHFYADGSGHPDYRPPTERGDTDHYCLVGILVNTAQREEIERRCDKILQAVFPDREPRTVEIKASWISARTNQKPPWDALPGPRHAQLFDEIRDLLLEVKPQLFGQIVHKESYRQGIRASRPERPATNVLRFVLARLDHHLEREGQTSTATLDSDSRAMQEAQLELESSVRAQGDKIAGETRPPMAVSRFERVLPLRHLNSNQSRCLQMADYVAHGLWQAAEYGKAQRLRELDPLWATYGSKREPWTAFIEPGRVALIKD
jgi:hypothetical protein